EVDSVIDGAMDDRDGFGFGSGAAEHHGPQAQLRNLHATGAQEVIAHGKSSQVNVIKFARISGGRSRHSPRSWAGPPGSGPRRRPSPPAVALWPRAWPRQCAA